MRIAVTGHRDLDRPTSTMVDSAIHQLIGPFAPDITGISCLAAGADQIFARAVLALGGRLTAVLPAAGYADDLDRPTRRGFDALLARARDVLRLDHVDPTPEAYLDAGLAMLDRAELLVAVWDGTPARGVGGTAQIVACAAARGVPVQVVWPAGSSRLTGRPALIR